MYNKTSESMGLSRTSMVCPQLDLDFSRRNLKGLLANKISSFQEKLERLISIWTYYFSQRTVRLMVKVPKISCFYKLATLFFTLVWWWYSGGKAIDTIRVK